jgi:hypothetical protein
MRVQLLFAIDTTGSMSPAISEVRRKLVDTVQELFREVPALEIGIVGFGDYCDRNFYRMCQFTTDVRLLYNFIHAQHANGGGDAPECYEYVLHHVQKDFNWDPKAEKKILAVIGDEVPHRKGTITAGHRVEFDWIQETKALVDMNIAIYGVQCLQRRHAEHFYQTLADVSNGAKVDLYQFHNILELIEAVAYKQVDRLDEYEERLVKTRRMNRAVAAMLEGLRHGKKSTKVSFKDSDLEAVPPSRFQLLHIDEEITIQKFVENTGFPYRKGRGFYHFTKRELIQEKKEVVLRDKVSGDMWTGAKAREMIGLPYGMRGKLSPTYFEQYDVFVQSTSYTRKLKPDTMFLYEAD